MVWGSNRIDQVDIVAVLGGQDPLLTVLEIAMTLRLTAQTVRAWVKDGRLPALKLGRRLRGRRSDLEAFLDGSWSRLAP